MRNAQKPEHIALFELVDRIRDGRYVIPDFQRKFVWDPSKIRDLMRSIFLDYYIGTLLLWKGKPDNVKALSCESIEGYDASFGGRPEHIVLDGQQRLSAMHYAFMAPRMNAPARRSRYLYFIKIDRLLEEAYDDAFVYSWGDWGWGRRVLEDEEEQFRKHLLPLAIVGRSKWSLEDWYNAYKRFWEAEERSATDSGEDRKIAEYRDAVRVAHEFADHVRDIYRSYQVTYIELDDDLAIDKVCDIFQKINSTGQALDIFDLLNAILRPKDVGLKKLWREAEERLSFRRCEEDERLRSSGHVDPRPGRPLFAEVPLLPCTWPETACTPPGRLGGGDGPRREPGGLRGAVDGGRGGSRDLYR